MGSVRGIVLFGLMVVLAAAGALGFHSRDYAQKNLIIAPAEHANYAVAQSFSANIWAPAMGNQARPLCRPNCPDFSTLSTQGQFFFTTMPLVFIRVYDAENKTLLSIGGTFASSGLLEQQTANALASVRSEGVARSFLTTDEAYTMPDGSQKRGQAVHSFVPITTFGQISEVVEVVSDVTPYWGRTMYLQWVSIAFILAILGLLYLLQRWNASSSESIIESQHAEQADLVAAKTKAEEESVEKSKFLANVSHELRTPLNSIIGFSEILKNEIMGTLGNPQYKEYATDIHASGTHLLSLINDILDFSKADANKLEIEYQETDVTKLMQNCLRLMAQRAETAGIKLIPEIPAGDHVVAQTDPKRLKQVVLNLLTNAIKFTAPGGSVTLACLRSDLNKKMIIAVSDTGVGIAEKDISKVMSPFGQVKNEYSSKSEGTGLGLPLTRKLVELMGGQFLITSKLGEGTRVTLTFNDVIPTPTELRT
jgi:two-component system cell cycle sensor histidine kinase PleC